MTLPAYRVLIDEALRDLAIQGAVFSSRTRLISCVALSTGISESTVYRYVRNLNVHRLIDTDCQVTFICKSSDTVPASPACPPVSEPDETPAQTQCATSPLAGAHAHPYISPSASSSASPPAESPELSPSPESDPVAPRASIPARPFVGGLDDPAMAPLTEGHARRRTKRKQTEHDGHCVVCGIETPAGWGWYTVPYPRHEPCPVHCVDCWELIDHAERVAVAAAIEAARDGPREPEREGYR